MPSEPMSRDEQEPSTSPEQQPDSPQQRQKESSVSQGGGEIKDKEAETSDSYGNTRDSGERPE